jgi:hypothetical protein
MNVPTFDKRRQWRHRKPPTLADLVRADRFGGLLIVLTAAGLGFCLCLMFLLLFFGDGFINLFIGH